MIGGTVSHYKILTKLGEGGMGVVYKAEDLRLKRTVALKFLSSSALAGEEERARFVHEAQAAAALRHPGICTVYEIDEAEGKIFIVMEYVEGLSLKQKIASGAPSREESLDYICRITDALQEAHDKKIVHRDIKPANIIITPRGQPVLTDFGLAKSSRSAQVTRTGTTVGTAAYMSPEQARGEDVDQRSDIWSVGVMLYEMTTGVLPFKGEFEHAVIYSILNSEPEPPSRIKTDIPARLEKVVLKALSKDPDRRYQSIGELKNDLTPFAGPPKEYKRPSLLGGFKRPAVAIPFAVLVMVIGFLSIHYVRHAGRVRWARKVALPQIAERVENERYVEAFELAKKAKEIIPSDPILLKMWLEMTTTVSIHTSPDGASTYYKNYEKPESEWNYLGRSPIDNATVPKGFFRWKVKKDGYEPVEAVGSSGLALRFELDETGTLPEGMVKIPAGNKRSWVGAMIRFGNIAVEDFLMDKFEVSNEQYKAFVDNGGYRRRELWKHDFVKDGEAFSWEEAMEFFRDATGRTGPAMWELSRYLEGQGSYPVTGVSWYEAAAYAEFAGKSLPTVHHWIYAASISEAAHIVPMSNVGRESLAPVGSHYGTGYYGTYDMAGNAREWCYNRTGVNRFILGGCWSDPSYMFHFADARSAFDRSPGNGFRCVIYLREDSALSAARQETDMQPARDYSKEKPVPSEILDAYLDTYAYDKTPLNARTEFVDETPEHWTIEKISYAAAYGSDRMFAYLFLPRGFSPPYQTVVLYPGAAAMEQRSSNNGRELHSWDAVDFVVKSGRAVLYPVYISTYERWDGYNIYDPNATMTALMDHIIWWWKDLSKSVDYLETRDDIDREKLCYYGSSQGAWIAPIYLGQDERFKAAILRLGGFLLVELNPSIDPINFAPRVKIPVLMLNGKYDYIFPYERSQLPMFKTFGTPPENKRHVVFETAHSLHGHRNEMIRETLDWLDRYLGPVE